MGSEIKVRCLLCRCQGEVDAVIDLKAIAAALAREPQVEGVVVRDALCQGQDRESLAAGPGEARILIGACSCLARGDTLLETLQASGVDPLDVELVDLREGCAWIHRDDARGATCKALDLCRMGLAALTRRERSQDPPLEVSQRVVVLGAGPAGLAAAAALGRLGVEVVLLDRSAQPGGLLNLIAKVAPEDIPSAKRLAECLQALERLSTINFMGAARLEAVSGEPGDFTLEVKTRDELHRLRAGAVILATGARIRLPKGRYRYGELEGVLAGIELERRLQAGPVDTQAAVFVQCVGVRDDKTPYCSTICCPASLKQARMLREGNPDCEVSVLHRDMMCPGAALEDYYHQAMEAGVRFVRYPSGEEPLIEGEGKVRAVRVRDAAGGDERTLTADLVVLSSPLEPPEDNQRLAALFGLSCDPLGFLGVRTLMHPLETTASGVFVCGSARWPVLASLAMQQGEAAAMKAYGFLRRTGVPLREISPFREAKLGHATVDEDACTGCGNCVAACPYQAVRLEPRDNGGRYRSVVSLMRCTGCGMCVAVCPNGSIQLPEQNAALIGEMLREAFA